MSRSPKWRNRRREERQAEAAGRLKRAKTLTCGCHTSLDPVVHCIIARHYCSEASEAFQADPDVAGCYVLGGPDA